MQHGQPAPDLPAAESSPWKSIAFNGIWKQNAGVVQLLGLCPVLAVSTSIVNGVSLGLATTLVTALSGAAVAAVRQWVPSEIRNPIFITIIAALVTMVDLAMNAWVHGLYNVLGIFIPLITTNCIVLARAEAFASKNPVRESAWDGLMMGLGLTGVLGLLGAMRELFGKGTLFSGIDLVFGPAAGALTLHLAPENYQFLLALLPPGAFLGLACLIAGKNWLESRRQAQSRPATVNGAASA
ncbi:electron transport complex subunit E [Laribacter hongkongensis]|uniref:electron transport complex subunit E n=1 Tax=Laribacter hongkongensis TaxID=168471 RepID=UPI001EFC70C0|nr:electron transport complex subunit E [Laribacter hongkongensis]MCG9075805.1 electron transport complex subunit E [Laribacter hongkongensis]